MQGGVSMPRIFLFLLGFALFSNSLFASDLLKVSTRIEKQNQYMSVMYVDVVSKTDSIQIDKVIVNRGNCKQVGFKSTPIVLKLGQKVSEMFQTCAVLEIEIITNQGTIAYSTE